MRRFIMFIAAVLFGLAAAPALASTWVYREGADSITLTDEPCASLTAMIGLLTHAEGEPKAARVHYQGRDHVACWALMEDPTQVLIFTDHGTAGPVPVQAFKPSAL